MALKVLMLRKKKENLQKELDKLRNAADFETREKEIENAINELNEDSTDEEKKAVEDEVEKLESEKAEHDEKVDDLEKKISEIEDEIKKEEEKQPKPEPEKTDEAKRKESVEMDRRSKFFGKTVEERNAFFARDDVKEFIERVRSCIKEKRALTNVGLTIPDVTLPMITEIAQETSKLIKYVNFTPLRGTGRQNIMGTIPEAVWTEMCANLNELDLGFNNTEVDGYKVGGFFAVCNAILEDSDVELMSTLLDTIGKAIGKAIDKAIVYGKGIKMPLGFITRLAQQEKPSDYADTEREWKDLHTSNIITITGKTGLELFKEIVKALKVIKNDYSTDGLVWVMNQNTHIDLLVEAMGANMNAAIVSGMTQNTMPVVGGTIEELEFMADGDIAFGYCNLYLLVQRHGTQLGQSEHVRFLEDQTVFKGTARYDGKPVIAEGFGLMNISGKTPTTEVLFSPDKANPQDAQLTSLTIGSLNLFPKFDANTYEYMLNTKDATNKITATPSNKKAEVTIKNGETPVTNGQNATWVDGENKLTVEVEFMGVTQLYTVTVNKAAAAG